MVDPERFIIPDAGKLKNIGLIPERQHTLAGSKIYFHGVVEVGVAACVTDSRQLLI